MRAPLVARATSRPPARAILELVSRMSDMILCTLRIVELDNHNLRCNAAPPGSRRPAPSHRAVRPAQAVRSSLVPTRTLVAGGPHGVCPSLPPPPLESNAATRRPAH